MTGPPGMLAVEEQRMEITTLPVYSRLADLAEIPAEVVARLPEGWQLSQHQLWTYHSADEV